MNSIIGFVYYVCITVQDNQRQRLIVDHGISFGSLAFPGSIDRRGFVKDSSTFDSLVKKVRDVNISFSRIFWFSHIFLLAN